MDTKGTLRLGGGLTQIQRDALDAGKIRAQDMIRSAGVALRQPAGERARGARDEPDRATS